jgi:hypothetical protein
MGSQETFAFSRLALKNKHTEQDSHMDNYWAEVADHIETIEQLYEDDKFPNRELAALVASKVDFHAQFSNFHAMFDSCASRGLCVGAHVGNLYHPFSIALLDITCLLPYTCDIVALCAGSLPP